MEKLFALVRLASLLIAAVAVGMILRTPPAPAPDAVREAFAAYKHAVQADDGVAAAELLSRGTVDWYGMLLDEALHGSREEVAKLQPVEQIQILAFRQRVPANELQGLTGRQLVELCIAHGWIGKSGIERTEIGSITVADDSAAAQVLVDGKDSGQQYHFLREAGQWRFDHLATIPAASSAIVTSAQQRGLPVDQFVQMVIESTSRGRGAVDLWEPPFPRATPGATP